MPSPPEYFWILIQPVDREKELVAAGVLDDQKLDTHSVDAAFLQTEIAPDTMVDVHNGVVGLKRAKIFQDRAGRARPFGATMGTLAEDFLFGDDDQPLGRDHTSADELANEHAHRFPRSRTQAGDDGYASVGQKRSHPVGLSGRSRRDGDRKACFVPAPDALDQWVEGGALSALCTSSLDRAGEIRGVLHCERRCVDGRVLDGFEIRGVTRDDSAGVGRDGGPGGECSGHVLFAEVERGHGKVWAAFVLGLTRAGALELGTDRVYERRRLLDDERRSLRQKIEDWDQIVECGQIAIEPESAPGGDDVLFQRPCLGGWVIHVVAQRAQHRIRTGLVLRRRDDLARRRQVNAFDAPARALVFRIEGLE